MEENAFKFRQWHTSRMLQFVSRVSHTLQNWSLQRLFLGPQCRCSPWPAWIPDVGWGMVSPEKAALEHKPKCINTYICKTCVEFSQPPWYIHFNYYICLTLMFTFLTRHFMIWPHSVLAIAHCYSQHPAGANSCNHACEIPANHVDRWMATAGAPRAAKEAMVPINLEESTLTMK